MSAADDTAAGGPGGRDEARTGPDGDRTQVVTRPPQPGQTAPGAATGMAPGAARPGDDATVISVPGTGFSAPPTRSAPPATHGGGTAEAGVLPAGSRLAEFEITGLVGQGGFGAVYEAWDHALERVVAIKEYLPVSLSTRQADGSVVPLSERQRDTFDLGMRSFINEARLLAQFDHPSLLKVYRFWQERGTTYMVMPFYRGETLRQALAAIPSGVDEAWLLRIMDGVTQALGVMHGASCYHRDIAPDNIILLEGSGRPVVLDFGAARRVITDKTQAITVILKPGYAPIEQYAEMPDMSQGAWTDVYALAAVMHVAVCGRAPPPSVARLLSDSYVPLAGNALLRERYGERLLTAIDAGLGVRPESRPQSMAELREALGLEPAQTGAPSRPAVRVPARPAPVPAPPPASAPSSSSSSSSSSARRAVLAAAAGLAVAGLGGAAWWWRRGSDPGAVGTAGEPGDRGAPGTGPLAQAPAPAPAPTAPPPPAPAPPWERAGARTPAESLEM
ncbi:MAG: serine/threonine protein kinase, partial [Comamonadaceae bacterium]